MTADQAVHGQRVTIKDVADAAGVSRSTTSRALTGRGYVAPQVRERVQRAARTLGYVPDATARHLKQQVSRTIGVVVSDLRNAFYADLAGGIGRLATARGFTMMLVDDAGTPAQELAAAETLVALRVAGVVMTPVSPTGVQFLRRHRVPVVEVDRRFTVDGDAAVVDNRSASETMTAEVLALGHTRVAMLIDEMDWTTGRDRLAGYRAAHTAAGLTPDPTLVARSGWDAAAARASARRLLERPDRPTAVFAANNVIAEGAWRAAADLGLSIPEDVSLVGFDDAPWMSMVTPAVTAVAQDVVALGEAALRQLLERIEEPSAPARTVMLAAPLVRRGSTAPPRP